ncbi:hypothetical protein A3L04_09065 [Thermococcus chitonophagus]|uniref:CRISPR-associated protein DxTHG n=1 Tax=Thermococcus chitonophagus TaxID=54262 RepID=A0A160VSZ0_9EURY|nr:CRISPR-associated CARF protein Csx1 [Thermococcus chitonophagus]ASJ17204.1 hypothetical protein A3L04_09065 [Thermococcus chitonophagus]CUX77819.1 CRISPR-associated protein DxTHG [Thermococcus chitonophagus]
MEGEKFERVLITTWGNPFGWKETAYYISGLKDEVKTRSTLPVLVAAYNPDLVIIIALDTLVNYIGCKDNINNCSEIWPYPDEDGRFEDVGSYEKVIENVENRIWRYVEELCNESTTKAPGYVRDALREFLDTGKIKTIVAPGIGDFKAKVTKATSQQSIEVRVTVENGHATDYYHFIMAKLAELLPSTNLEIILDLTHGLNFMPVLTYRAVRELSTIGAYFGRVKLTVVNAEPYPKAGGALQIHVIEDSEILPSPMYFKVNNQRWDAFISALANGFPLAFAKFFPSKDQIFGKIRDILESYEDTTKVETENGTENRRVIISRGLELDERLSGLALLYYAVKRAKDSPELNGITLPKEELTIDEIDKIARIFEKIPAIGERVRYEVKKLRNLNNKSGPTWEPRSKLDTGWNPHNRICQNNNDKNCIKPRNFIAHSGLEMNVVELKLGNNTLFVRYPPSKENIVVDLCNLALSRKFGGECR